MKTLSGKTALVTGGRDGIGFAIASAFATAGANVTIVGRDTAKLDAARAMLATHGTEVRIVAADLATGTAIAEVASVVGDHVDILVNNVGLARLGPLAALSTSDLSAMLHMNVAVPLLLTQAFLKSLIATRGNVINISSYWATKMVAGRASAAYSATRGAIESMTKALANELGPESVRVNAIAPGSIRTPTFESAYLAKMNEAERARYDRYVVEAYPLQHVGSPDDIGAAALYLASDAAKWVTGTVLEVNGGMTVR